ncbi:ethanolamine ammonia-lyase reactivating factor EutA [Salmonella enterica subsp. enterica]|nr:ethanolamine ammonia-lyase reactivating factor EutA [Salmonella enterica subsp. enterica]
MDSGAIIITGESAKTRNARPAVMTLSQSLGDFCGRQRGRIWNRSLPVAAPGAWGCLGGGCAGAEYCRRRRVWLTRFVLTRESQRHRLP